MPEEGVVKRRLIVFLAGKFLLLTAWHDAAIKRVHRKVAAQEIE
jgi:hypothetical protein